MQYIQKSWLSLSLIASLHLIPLAQASTIPFIDENIAIIHSMKDKKTFKKQNLASYFHENSLDLSSGNLTDKDIPEIIQFLKKHPEITHLNLSRNNELTGEGLVQFAQIQNLQVLNLARSFKSCKKDKCKGGLSSTDVQAFENHPSMLELNLDLHNIGDIGAIALSKNTHIRSLSLAVNNITDVGGSALALNQNLVKLDLGANPVGSKTAVILAKNASLKQLSLSQTEVDDEGGIALASSSKANVLDLNYTDVGDMSTLFLVNNPYLSMLMLAGTNIGVDGAKILAQTDSFYVLDLAGDFFGRKRKNDIGDVGASSFAQNQSLQKLDLSSQQITVLGAVELAKNKKLYQLYLGGNRGIGDEGAEALAQRRYTSLDLSACKITDKGAIALSKNAKNSDLYLMSNLIGDEGAIALAKGTPMLTLYLIVNDIQDSGALAFVNESYIHNLNLDLNRVTAIGRTAIRNHSSNWSAEGENPFNDAMASTSNDYPMILETNKEDSSDKRVCYRTKTKLACTSRQNIVFARGEK